MTTVKCCIIYRDKTFFELHTLSRKLHLLLEFSIEQYEFFLIPVDRTYIILPVHNAFRKSL